MNSKAFEIALALKGKLENSFMSSLSKAEKSVESCKKAFDTLAKQKVDLDKVFEARRSTLNASKAYFQAQKKVEDLQHALKTATSGQDKLKAELLKAVQSMHKANDALNRQKEALAAVEKQAGTTGKSIKDLQAQNEDLEKSIEKQAAAQKKAQKAEALKQTAQSIDDKSNDLMLDGAGKIAGGIATIMATIGKPIKDAMNFENAQAELGKFSEKAQQVMELNKNLARSYAVSVEDMVALQTNAMQSAIVDPNDIEGIKKYTEVASQAVVALGISGDEVGESFSTIQSQIAGNMEDTIKAFDLVNQISNATTAGAKDILEVLSRTGGAVSALTSLATPQVVALAGAFRSASDSSEVAATAQASFINSLMAGRGATDTQIAGYKALGLSAEKIAKGMVADSDTAVKTMQEVFAKINALADEDKSVVIGQIFGNEAGLKKAIATMASQADILNIPMQLSLDEKNYTGSMYKEYEVRSETTENKIQILLNNLTNLSAALGETLLPVIKILSEKLSSLIEPTTKWITENKETVKTIGLAVAAYGGFLIALGSVQFALGFILKPIAKLYKAYTMIGPVLGFVSKGFSGLVTILGILKTVMLSIGTGALKILIFGFKMLGFALNFAKVAAITSLQVFGLLSKGVWLAITAFKALSITLLTTPIGWIILVIMGLIAAGIALYKNWDYIKEKALQLWAYLSQIWDSLVTSIESGIDKAINLFSSIISYISSVFTNAWNTALTNVSNVFSNIFNGLKDIALTPLNFILDKIGMVKNALGGAVDSVKSFFGFGDSDTQVSVNKAITTTASMPSVNVPALASGGITTGPTLAMIGEGAEQEAVMPLSRLKEFIGLTSSTSNTSNSETVVINFNPTINVNGSGDIESQISQAMQQAAVNVRQEIERYFSQRRRLAYD